MLLFLLLQDINEATVMLQKKRLTLSDCRHVLEDLMDDVSKGKKDKDSSLYRCQFETDYIAIESAVHANFEAGILKIQRNDSKNMNQHEVLACESLRNIDSEHDIVADSNESAKLSFAKRSNASA